MPAEQVPLMRVEPMPPGAAGPAAHAASGTKVFRPWRPDQAAWLPASKREYRGEGHLAVCLRDLLPHLDSSSRQIERRCGAGPPAARAPMPDALAAAGRHAAGSPLDPPARGPTGPQPACGSIRVQFTLISPTCS
jgi:hypothetical protein